MHFGSCLSLFNYFDSLGKRWNREQVTRNERRKGKEERRGKRGEKKRNKRIV